VVLGGQSERNKWKKGGESKTASGRKRRRKLGQARAKLLRTLQFLAAQYSKKGERARHENSYIYKQLWYQARL